MSNRDDPTGPRRGQRKAERTRRLVVDRLVFLIEQGNDLQDMSVEQMLCGTRGRNDGVIHHSTLYHHLDKAGESSHRDRILQKGGLIARWLQEDDPASYVRFSSCWPRGPGRLPTWPPCPSSKRSSRSAHTRS